MTGVGDEVGPQLRKPVTLAHIAQLNEIAHVLHGGGRIALITRQWRYRGDEPPSLRAAVRHLGTVRRAVAAGGIDGVKQTGIAADLVDRKIFGDLREYELRRRVESPDLAVVIDEHGGQIELGEHVLGYLVFVVRGAGGGGFAVERHFAALPVGHGGGTGECTGAHCGGDAGMPMIGEKGGYDCEGNGGNDHVQSISRVYRSRRRYRSPRVMQAELLGRFCIVLVSGGGHQKTRAPASDARTL